MRSTSVTERFNAYAPIDSGSLIQIPANSFLEDGVIIEPLDVEHSFAKSIFRYRIVPPESVIVSR